VGQTFALLQREVTLELTFDGPAIYRISVKGHLSEDWSDRLGGMAICYSHESGAATTALCGRLLDQAALLGVLNALYSLHLPLLSVEHLGND
jgi:hypothetical protein